MGRPKKINPAQNPTARNLLETIDFPIVRNFFLYSLSPRGIKATIARRVTIELQKENNDGLMDLFKNPGIWLMFIMVLIVLATVVYPALSNQAPMAECQSKLTACISAAKTGMGVS